MSSRFLRWEALLLAGLLVMYATWSLLTPLGPPTAKDFQPVVAVTGASGFLAGNIIRQLISKGYTVRGSVRDLSATHKVGHLKKMFPTLVLYEADLLVAGSFDPMLKGANYLIHTASPFIRQVPDPERDLVRPAVNGTANVIRSALRSGTVSRIILTSSTAAISTDSPPADPRRPWTEADWNLESTITSNPYRLSKRMAEELAWRLISDNHIRHVELVAMNPSFILGPPLSSRTDATSVSTMKSILEGQFLNSGTLPVCFGAVDVRDVARAHVAALTVPEVAGHRFILSSETGYTYLDFAHMLEGEFGDWPLPKKQQPGKPYCPVMNNTKAQRMLGIRFTPLATTVNDMAQQMVKLKMVTRPSWHQPPLSVVLSIAIHRAAKRALGGGFAGMIAMVIQVFSLMWLRTAMNYQYRHGHSTREALFLLYKEGGVGRFYQGLTPALIQGPLSRFCDTAANAGVLSLLDAFAATAALPIGIRTVMASVVAALARILLMPVDALKTIMQVEGRPGATMLLRKVQDNGPSVLFAGALASVAAGFVGHYPWFATYNSLDVMLPHFGLFRSALVRNAFIGVCATICSDTCSNALRVVKTQVQTSAVPVPYSQVVRTIWRQEGVPGFFRGLKTRMLVNVLQGALFSVLWRWLMDIFA